MINAADYLQDSQGRLVHRDLIKPIDLLRDELVRQIVQEAEPISQSLMTFKQRVCDQIEAFLQLSSEQYGVKRGGAKGNVTLLSFDARLKVTVDVQDVVMFDERLQAAKTLIDECFHDWSLGAGPELQAIVTDAFRTDRAGKIRTSLVLSLRRLDIQDDRWKKAMSAIVDSITVTHSRSYVRVYKRGSGDNWQRVCLDLAGA